MSDSINLKFQVILGSHESTGIWTCFLTMTVGTTKDWVFYLNLLNFDSKLIFFYVSKREKHINKDKHLVKVFKGVETVGKQCSRSGTRLWKVLKTFCFLIVVIWQSSLNCIYQKVRMLSSVNFYKITSFYRNGNIWHEAITEWIAAFIIIVT